MGGNAVPTQDRIESCELVVVADWLWKAGDTDAMRSRFGREFSF